TEEADKMRTEAAVLEAQLDVVRVKLDRTLIRAPLGGAVAARLVSVGEVVKVGQTLYKLVQDNPLKFRTPVPERFAGYLKLGQKIRVKVDAYPDRVFAKGDLVYDLHGDAVVVPEKALTTFAGVTKLFVVADGKAEERIVRMGV